MSHLEILGVAKTLGESDRVAVLREVTLRVQGGQCLGLKGATGSGKTTLLRLIAGLERLDQGEIRIDGLAVSGPKVHIPAGRRRVGFVFQTLGLWPHLSVDGHLDYVLQASPFRGDERVRRKRELLQAFHLGGLENRRPGELSGGERHLLAIARALAPDIRMLLLDEPFAGLDGQLRDLVIDALGRIRRERQLTTVLVSHDIFELRALSNELVYLREGHVVGQPSPLPSPRGPNGGDAPRKGGHGA
ncbi:MAG: ATP-binding cassette domain-containing protein [Planctomycetota bacterium]|nr:ATP-binding cassette domain-containing protein [Planctomycetota bacterium]